MPTANYPSPRFHFRVEWGGNKISFSDVSGLSPDSDPVDYRDDGLSRDSALKIAGNVTLKHGLMDPAILLQWREQGRRDVTIAMLDETGQLLARFHLRNAQPQKWVGPTLKAKGGGEVAMEELQLTHEGLSCEKPDSHPRQGGRPARKP